MQNNDGDTFRSIRTAWIQLTGTSRDKIITKKDPLFPAGFPQWIAYMTGTQITAAAVQDRLKRVLINARFSSLADSYCRFMWGRSTFTTNAWGKLMSASMPSWVEFFLTTHFNMHHKMFGVQCTLISDADLELLNQCFDWKSMRFETGLLEELFLPIRGEANHQNLKPPTEDEWDSVMAESVIPEHNHAGRGHRHPRFLCMLSVTHYEKLLKRLKNHKGSPVVSGSLLVHLATSIIPILSSFMHLVYYLYAPAEFLPGSNSSLDLRLLDLCERLRPFCFPTKEEKASRAKPRGSLDDDIDMDDDEDDDLEVQEKRMQNACTALLYNIKRTHADWKRGENTIETVRRRSSPTPVGFICSLTCHRFSLSNRSGAVPSTMHRKAISSR